MPVPADIYKNDVDFALLALQYPDFAKKYVHNAPNYTDELRLTDPCAD